MRAKALSLMAAAMFAVSLSGCYTVDHTVGSGPSEGIEVSERQWFALWGLVPISEANTQGMVGDAENYTFTTTHTFVDYVISAFTGFVTIYPMTVKVTK